MYGRKILFKLSDKEILFLVSLFLITFSKGIGLDSSSGLYLSVTISSFILILLKVTLEKWKIKDIYLIFLIVIIFGVSFIINHEEALLFTSIIAIGSKGISLKKIFSVMIISRVLGFIYNFFGTMLGFVENRSILFYRDGQIIVRNDFGFGHPNLLHSSILIIVLLYFFLRYYKISIMDYCVILSINYFFFQFSASRTGYYSVIIAVLIHIISRSDLYSNILRKIVPYVQFTLSFITLLLAYLYNNTLIQRLDILLTGRIYYSHEQLKYPLTLFGRDYSQTKIIFDNSYSMLFSEYGLIISGIFLISYFYVSKKVIHLKDFRYTYILLILSIVLFTESYYTNILYNISLFIVVKIYFNDIEEATDVVNNNCNPYL